MAKKLTIDSIKHTLTKVYPHIEILSDVYVRSNQKIKFKCNIHEYEWDSTWSIVSKRGCPVCNGAVMTTKTINEKLKLKGNNLYLKNEYLKGSKRGVFSCSIHDYEWETTVSSALKALGCPICSKRAPVTNKNLKDKIKSLNPNINIVGFYKEPIKSHEKISVECKACGNCWRATSNSLRSGSGCPSCNGGVKRDLESIIEELKSIMPTVEILSDSYINSSSDIKAKCKVCGYEWTSKWSYLKSGYGCHGCNGGVPIELEDVKDKIEDRFEHIKVISNEYKNSNTKLSFLCERHNYLWDAKYPNLLRGGAGCPICAKESLDGAYSKKVADRNKHEWLKIKCILYIIKCTGRGEEFYKIGITKNSIKDRFVGIKNMPYKYEVLKEIKLNLYDAIYLEKDLHELNDLYKYIPKIKFGGYTECFSHIDMENTMKLIAEKVGED